MLSVKGDASGYWINLGPGQLRLSPIYSTAQEAARHLGFYQRSCGIHPLSALIVES